MFEGNFYNILDTSLVNSQGLLIFIFVAVKKVDQNKYKRFGSFFLNFLQIHNVIKQPRIQWQGYCISFSSAEIRSSLGILKVLNLNVLFVIRFTASTFHSYDLHLANNRAFDGEVIYLCILMHDLYFWQVWRFQQTDKSSYCVQVQVPSCLIPHLLFLS